VLSEPFVVTRRFDACGFAARVIFHAAVVATIRVDAPNLASADTMEKAH
jgi:hypothetical protein